jgi:hypothetical protein
MAITAKFCVPVVSRWVIQFILTCDEELAVTFKKHNVCCLYPGTTRALFQMAVTWASPGKFVWQFLYKKRGYRLIKSPCPPVGCVTCSNCTNQLPATLYATVAGESGSAALTWDATTSTWTGSKNLACGGTLYIKLACSGSGAANFLLGTSWDGIGYRGCIFPDAGNSCSPLSVNFSTCRPAGTLPAGCANSYSVTVTT